MSQYPTSKYLKAFDKETIMLQRIIRYEGGSLTVQRLGEIVTMSSPRERPFPVIGSDYFCPHRCGTLEFFDWLAKQLVDDGILRLVEVVVRPTGAAPAETHMGWEIAK